MDPALEAIPKKYEGPYNPYRELRDMSLEEVVYFYKERTMRRRVEGYPTNITLEQLAFILQEHWSAEEELSLKFLIVNNGVSFGPNDTLFLDHEPRPFFVEGVGGVIGADGIQSIDNASDYWNTQGVSAYPCEDPEAAYENRQPIFWTNHPFILNEVNGALFPLPINKIVSVQC